MTFRRLTDEQRAQARAARTRWLEFAPEPLPDVIRGPFVLWPLQLIGDKVNQWDLNVSNWCELLRHFQASLPARFQFVIKPHPRSKAHDNSGVAELTRELPNTVLLPARAHLKTLLSQCHAVVGANSTVLMEARLMFHKPVYAYASGWTTTPTGSSRSCSRAR